jgi:hypothetical protein
MKLLETFGPSAVLALAGSPPGVAHMKLPA